MLILRRSLIVVALATLAACAAPQPDTAGDSRSQPAGIELVEAVDRVSGELVIPYRKYRLDNGLTVILHEDRSDPLVHVDVTYHVGSAREDIGKSGFAHFFEHMMFNGSQNVADEEHFRLITEAGGTLNGTTNSDRTNYFQTVPNNQLERMLWLEADRMGFLLPAVTQQKFEVQRETVKNERGQRVDNRPYGLVSERLGEALYPEGHPYSWMTIGYIEDLDRVDVNDLKAFFLRWYGPNNATLTIGGDFDRQQTLEWIVKYFGSIPRGPEVDDPDYIPFSLPADRYISFEDRVALPLLVMAWPTVYARHADEAPLDVLMSIIGQGGTSMLYKNLVKEGLAVQASTGHGCQELSCSFTVQALPNPGSGTTLADLERIVRETFEEFERRGVEDDDLARLKAQIVSGQVFSLESVAGKVSQLAYFETLFDNPNLVAAEIARYEAVTKADVMRVYRQYIKGRPAVILSVVPEGAGDTVARADTWQRYERKLPEYMTVNVEDLAVRVPVDDFDRSVVPPAGANPEVHLPDIWRDELTNGVEILGAVNDEVPTTTMMLRIKTGQRDEPLDKLGLARLTAAMLNERTERSSLEELSNALQKLGSSVSVGAGDDYTTMTVRSLTENLDATLDIAAEKLFEPGFDEDDLERLKAQTIEGIRQSKTDAGALANKTRRLLLYGEDNAFAHPNTGSVESVSAITVDDIKSFYRDRYSPSIADLVVVSSLPQSAIVDKLSRFERWAPRRVAASPAPSFPPLKAGTLYFMDRPGAAQSEIRITRRAIPYDATGEFYRANLTVYPLGGNFNSRINQNLREDKGYTYGAQAGFGGNAYVGTFTASAAVRTDATADAIQEFVNEINGFFETGMTDAELAFTQSAIGQRDARAYETPRQKVGLLSQILTYDLDENFVEQQTAILNGFTTGTSRQLARRYLNLDDMILIVVGDKATVWEGLESLGFPIVELGADGDPLVAKAE